MLKYMRTIWREEYWDTRNWDVLVYTMKLARHVDKLEAVALSSNRDPSGDREVLHP